MHSLHVCRRCLKRRVAACFLSRVRSCLSSLLASAQSADLRLKALTATSMTLVNATFDRLDGNDSRYFVVLDIGWLNGVSDVADDGGV